MRHLWGASALAVLVGACLVLGGCTLFPTAPSSSTTTSGTSTKQDPPPLATIAPDGTMDFTPAPVETLPDDTTHVMRAAGLKTSEYVDGAVGGRVRAGRFSLEIPPGAFQGQGLVTLSMPDSTLMVCDLSIQPMALNHFDVPVKLTADLSAPGMTDASDCTNYWYDPTRMDWVSLRTKSQCSGTLITTTLEHFSRYGSGKAGW